MNTRLLRLYLFITLFSSFLTTHAQEYPIYNQYYFNYYLINPALAGVNDCSYFMLTHKQQWVGIEDAPYTTSMSYQTRFSGNIGMGVYVYNDNNGYSRQQGAQITAAYHIPLNSGARYTRAVRRDRQLSFAVSAKFFNYGFDPDVLSKLNTARYDQAMQDLQENLQAFNANVGAYYTSYGFFTGLSFTNIAKMKMPSYDTDIEPWLPLNGFFQIGNEFDMKNDETLEPSLMYMFNTQGYMTADLNLKYARKVPRQGFSYWLQLTGRMNVDGGDFQALTAIPILGLQFGKFHFAYAYGIDLNRLIRYNYGTHELMLGYTMCYVEKFCR
jgi:type IX secretion system PorP/SprF family membrane protein